MPSREAHLAEARANRSFAERLAADPRSSENDLRWAVTAAFYCAVHCVESHFARVGVHSDNHADRDALLRSDGMEVRDEVRFAYYDLYAMSRRARYQIGSFTADRIREAVFERLTRVTRSVGL